MTPPALMVPCGQCGAQNRVPVDRAGTQAWCGPCRTLAPLIDALATAWAGRVRVAKLNVDENPGTAARYGIQSIPALVLFRDGRAVDRLVGVQPRAAIEDRLRALLDGAPIG